MANSSYRAIFNPAGLMYAAPAAVAGTTIALLWPMSASTAPQTTIPQNALYTGQILKVTAGGIMTTAASAQGNLTVTPIWGTTTAGTSLGASAATALTASLTNVPWFLEMFVYCRSISNVASSSTLVCSGNLACPTNVSVPFGGAAVTTCDTTTAQGLAVGVTLGSASDTMTTQFVLLESVN